MNDLNEFLKKAFEYKNNAEYKKAIDFFYKALALDNGSCEIMFELAQLYSKLCRYDRAISFYEQITELDKNNYEVKLCYAIVQKKVNNFECAKKILKELLKVNDYKEKAAEELFSIYLLEDDPQAVTEEFEAGFLSSNSAPILYYAALAYDKTGRKQKAEEYYGRAFSLNPEDIKTGIKTAFILYEKNNLEEAEELVFKLLKYSEDASLLYLTGEIYYAKGDLDASIKYYSYAIKQDDKNAVYYFKLGIVFSLKGFFDEAETCYCKAAVLDSENAEYNYALAYLYYTAGKIKLSKKVAENILAMDKNNADAISLLILINLKENNIINAGKLVSKTENEDNISDFLHYAHAMYYAELNMREKAIEALLRAISLNNDSSDYKYELAKNYFYLKNYEKAEEICEIITEKSPKYIQAYILLAKIKTALGCNKAARDFLSDAMKLDANMYEIYKLLGDINYGDKLYNEALENYKTAVSINPQDEKCYERAAKCYYILENYECAYLYYKEAAEFDITNAEYRFYMAKSAAKSNNQDRALASFSLMKRLEPRNIEYLKEYALYLKEINNISCAADIIKTLMKKSNKEQKRKLKDFIVQLKEHSV